ncbi:DUF6538 domain-containing protein [Bosea sp. (in: a-proteobacteria)]|uniref:DUF6538 domain-containing protein n=1 Tax=Bosea sp. (in: a-proteobacteria) TaxID=1871050 RepID=UPI00260F07D6|nr:DUF6538 domain-containing protein [Bosea sp. (in: a-proteobacteria)]MCO5090027.1 tyrosine-type recombinase/integrase [Bosea sp. (in: a-proteobacteria)]
MSAVNGSAPSYLEKHGATYRVTYPIPKELQRRFGKKRLKESLGTGDLRKANRLKGKVIGRFDDMVELERAKIRLERGTAEDKAKLLHALLADPNQDHEGRQSARMDIDLEHSGLLGRPIGYEYVIGDDDEEIEVPIYDPIREANAQAFLSNALPDAESSLDAIHEEWLKTHMKDLTERTKADDRRALRYWKDWCRARNFPIEVRQFTRVMAYEFVEGFEAMSGGLQEVTRAKYLNRLTVFWQHLENKGLVAENVWANQKIRVPIKDEERLERAFKMDEIRRLLRGNPSVKLRDVMMIGMLTGARLEAIIRLKVEDIFPDRIKFGKRKKEVRSRFVPIHPLLRPILERRIAGKAPKDDVFPDWPGPKKEGSMRERSFKASNAFTKYRKSCGVDEVYAGDRRSKVNFHSFRRWFISHMRMDAPLDMVRALVGHSHGNVTDDCYRWTGPRFKLAAEYISRLPIPPDTDEYVPDPESVNVYDTELSPKKQRRQLEEDVENS